MTGLALWVAFGNPRTESVGDESTKGNSTIRSPDVHSLAIDPSNQDQIFFGSHAGIKESDGGGYSWHNGTLQDADGMSLVAGAEDPSFMYVAGHDVLEMSIDSGENLVIGNP